jgi:hypothetical protein
MLLSPPLACAGERPSLVQACRPVLNRPPRPDLPRPSSLSRSLPRTHPLPSLEMRAAPPQDFPGTEREEGFLFDRLRTSSPCEVLTSTPPVRASGVARHATHAPRKRLALRVARPSPRAREGVSCIMRVNRSKSARNRTESSLGEFLRDVNTDRTPAKVTISETN